jgi:hypothetical protein
MYPIGYYRIDSNYNSADSADENDARNKREAKRKVVIHTPVMRQSDRKDTERLLNEAMQMATFKAKSQIDIDQISQNAAKLANQFLKKEPDTDPKYKADATPETNADSKPDQPFNNEVIDSVSSLFENKILQPSEFSKKLIDIESIFFVKNKISNPANLLSHLENFSEQLSNYEKISSVINNPRKKDECNEKIREDLNDFDSESLKCSIDFIDGYCEASSFNDNMKNDINNELYNMRQLLDQIANFNASVMPPVAIIEAKIIQEKYSTPMKSSELKPSLNRARINALDKDEIKKRDDTLPLTTLRSI